MEYLFFFLVGWLVVCLPALIYARVIEGRRRRDAAATEEKFKQVVKNLEFLEQRLRTLQFAGPPQGAAAPLPSVQPAMAPQPAASLAAPPAYAPLVAPKPAPAEQPAPTPPSPPPASPAPARVPQPAPASGPIQPICSKCGAGLAPGAQFCIRCGTPVKVLKPAAQPPGAPPPPPPPAMEPKTADAGLRTTQLESKPAPPPAVPPQSPAPPVKPAPAAHSAVSPGVSASAPPPRPSAPPPVPARSAAPSVAAAASVAKPVPKKPSRSFEEIVGTNWLPKLAVVILVVGVALLTANQWQHVTSWWRWIGPWGRDAVILLASLGLLFGGIKFESRVRYKTLGRAMIGGGWAMTFLVAYVIRHAEPFRILPSDAADLGVLLMVAGAMVWHTLRYKSQTVTGLAFLLGFTAVTINPDPPFNLIAGALLVTGMTVIVVRRQWFELDVVGILASYANHFYWLYQVYEQQGQRSKFPHHSASVALVIGYWAIFRTSYLVRKISAKEQESMSTLAGLLNPILFLVVMKYQGFHPDWAWWVLLAMGAVEFTLGQLPVSRQRRAPFQVLSSLGAALMIAAPFLKYSGNQLDVIWLAGAEAFLLAGIFTRERLFRGFGLIISFLVALHAVPVRIYPLAQQVLSGQPHHDGQTSLMLLLIAVALYLNAHVTRGLWPSLFEEEREQFAQTALSFGASIFVVAAIYAYVPDHAVAVTLALFAAWLSGTGKLLSISELVYEAHWVAALAFLQVIANDRSLEASWWRIPQRILAFASVAALLYLSSRFVRLSETAGKTAFSALYAWGATSLLTLLIWFQAADWAKPVFWIGLALALSVAAQWLKRTDLRWQAFVLVLLSAARALWSNFDLTQTFHSLTYRLISVSLIALGIYLLARWAPHQKIRPVYTVIGTLLFALLAFKETAAPWTAVAWVSLALVLCLAARWWKDRPLLWQTHFLSVLALAWTFYINFAPQYRGARIQWITVGIIAAAFYALTWLTEIAQIIGDARICQAYAWAGSLLLSWLAWYQLQPIAVSAAWGMFAILLFEFPELAKTLKFDVSRRAASWRGQAYVALAGSFAHIFYANFNVSGLTAAVASPAALVFIYFYVCWQLGRRELSKVEKRIRIGFLMACLGTATLAALARFELPADFVVIGYAGLVVGTLLVAWLTRQQTFLFQSLVMLGVTAFRISLHNFYHLNDAFSSSLSGAVWAIALLACAVPLAFQVRKNPPLANVPRWFRVFALYPEQPMFFMPVSLSVVLLYLKMSGWKLTGAWAVAGLVVWVLALWAKERSFRLTGLALVLLSVGKIVFWDVWQFNDARRYIALIAVSLILLILSFLYGKYREAIREYV